MFRLVVKLSGYGEDYSRSSAGWYCYDGRSPNIGAREIKALCCYSLEIVVSLSLCTPLCLFEICAEWTTSA